MAAGTVQGCNRCHADRGYDAAQEAAPHREGGILARLIDEHGAQELSYC